MMYFTCRYAASAQLLNIAALPAWAFPVVRLHQQRFAHTVNQSLSDTDFTRALRSLGIAWSARETRGFLTMTYFRGSRHAEPPSFLNNTAHPAKHPRL
jgi:hypothetical protein